MKGAPWTRKDVCPMTCMIEGMTAEVDRNPELQPILDRIVNQAEPYLTQLESKLNATKPQGLVATK